MTDTGTRTPGEAMLGKGFYYIPSEHGHKMSVIFRVYPLSGDNKAENDANIKTGMTAHTAANKMDALGDIDSDKAIELLPGIFEAWKNAEDEIDFDNAFIDYMNAVKLAKPD